MRLSAEENLLVLDSLSSVLEIETKDFVSEKKVEYKNSYIRPDAISKDGAHVVELKMFNEYGKGSAKASGGAAYWVKQNDRYFRSGGVRHVTTAMIAPSLELYHKTPAILDFYEEVVSKSSIFGRSHTMMFATNQILYPNAGYQAYNDIDELEILFEELMGTKKLFTSSGTYGKNNENEFVMFHFGQRV